MWFSVLLELFYPSHCAGCGEALFEKSRLCITCWNSLPRLSENLCPICSHELHAAAARCENCADRKLHFVSGVSSFRYQGLIRALVSQFKYLGDQSLKKVMGELIECAINDERLDAVTFEAVVPVPLHPCREREREFNQARLLAQEVALRSKLPMKDILRRIKPTWTQVHSDRHERIENLRDAFVLKKKHSLSGNYLLVDDVLTTGSTLDACAKVLLDAGADGVWAVTVARS
ncbi:MAG: ComF family protein [Chthoniobacterales bacterium]